MKPFSLALSLLCFLSLVACQSGANRRELAAARQAMELSIPLEKNGNYFIGRRVYKVDYKMWGYLRRPRESWADSRLVMFNEDKVLAPDRAQNSIGSDNNFEYRLLGHFSKDKVYEPASNGIYPEFILEAADLISKTPGSIFKDQRAADPKARYYPNPY
jgi:hypothetical protein